ncbi:MAG: FAD-binding protein, partial [Candidatus Kapaibacteriota bacterium]
VQYQCVIPHESAEESIQHIVRHMQTKKMGSFLVVLKSFGTIKSRGLLSFPMPGMTLAMDFPMRGSETLNLLSYFDEIVHEAGGRVYPAKDARMSGEHFRSWYPGFEQMIKLKDPKISSDFWRRVMK